jgi:hypothetical protein
MDFSKLEMEDETLRQKGIKTKGLTIVMIFVLIAVLFVGVPMNTIAETWTETTTEDFNEGETAFVDIENGTLQLARGLNRLWYGLGEGSSDYFGRSVSNAGDVNGDGFDDIIIGAPGTAVSSIGEAYVYHGSAKGPSSTPEWSDTGEASGDHFGRSVAGAGDVNGDGYDDIIVGAPDNDDGGSSAGKAYVYFGSANGLSITPDWSDIGKDVEENFSFSVSGAGDVNNDGYDDIIIGAYDNDSIPSNVGAAYVYYGSSSGPSTSPSWSELGEAAGDEFGYSVASAGDVDADGYDDIIIGAYLNDDAGSDAGEAYVYFGNSFGLSSFPGWSDQGESIGDHFGQSVSVAGDVNGDRYDDIIIGAPTNDEGGNLAGEAYVYFGSSTVPSATPDWSDQGEDTVNYFGTSTDGAGDVNGDGYDDIIIGAYRNDEGGIWAGKAYVYFSSSTGPSATSDWSELGEAQINYFGFSVSGASDVNGDGYDDIIIGAYENDDGGNSAGKAYLYGVPTDSIIQNWYDEGEDNDNRYGYSTASAGDVNGDGYEDVIVGAYRNDDGVNSWAGEAYVYHGSSTSLLGSPDWSDRGEAAGDRFGMSVASAGDVNGDGYDDVIIGAYGNDDNGSMAGEAYVYFGSASGLSAIPDWSHRGVDPGDNYGRNVAGVGDVNGDGYDDIIVGAHGNTSLGTETGSAYVYYGSSSGPSAIPDWADTGEAANNRFGYPVEGAGDVNDDGYDDIIIGAYLNDDIGANAGEAYVYYGSSTGLSASPDWSDQGEAATDEFGRAVAGAGDVNGDEYDDIIVGAYYNNSGGPDAGKVYVYFGSAIGPSTTPDWYDQGEATDDYFGRSAAGTGDVNDDGYDDIIIGAYGNDDAGSAAGKAYVYYGSSIGPSTTPDWSNTGEAPNDYFGFSVAGAGDVNGDEYDDIIVGAYGNGDGGIGAGKAYVFTPAQYAERGRFISDTFSVEGNEYFKWTSIEWRLGTQPDDTNIEFQIANNNVGSTWNFVGPDGTANTFFTNHQGQEIAINQAGRFIKVKIYLSTSFASKTPTITDFSINYVYVEPPKVEITSPNGGEDWMKGDYYPITWSAAGELDSSAISLYYTINNGATWYTIEENIPNNGYYNWTVPNIDTPSALIKVTVTDNYDNTASDTSDASFAIDPPPMRPGPGTNQDIIDNVDDTEPMDNTESPINQELIDEISEDSQTGNTGARSSNDPNSSYLPWIILLSIFFVISIILNSLIIYKRNRNRKQMSESILSKTQIPNINKIRQKKLSNKISQNNSKLMKAKSNTNKTRR